MYAVRQRRVRVLLMAYARVVSVLCCVCPLATAVLLYRFSVVATQTFKLPLRVVQFAFTEMEHVRDVDEIECLLANLIYRVSQLAQYSLQVNSV